MNVDCEMGLFDEGFYGIKSGIFWSLVCSIKNHGVFDTHNFLWNPRVRGFI